ncbi:chemotaxis protein CheW [Paenibacillus typhae]|uniref:Purine-binding chemotaxis protein CheW n=2 Tax=Paenibacillus typhae TaxID=1174501 RepID=A0A1G9D3L2_9BACL|nr:chemotaxis protein CheW [Paenibacillus typhae]SDK58526.1 purine-binding chemotaxis protein CheW [Paenibacillus typhae]
MPAGGSEQYIISRLGNERHAINIRDIDEIIKLQHITAVPNSRPFIRGVINLRGRIVPVISMCRRIGIPDTPIHAQSRIIVVRYQQEAIGIIVDAVEKVTSFEEIEPPLDDNETMGSEYMEGIGQVADGMISILNIQRLLGEGGNNMGGGAR